jgi:putative transposase
MPELLLLSRAQMRRISPFFPRPRGLPRVDDRRVISGIVYVIRKGLQWKDAPRNYGPHKTLYNRFVRWSRRGVFERIFAALAGEAGTPERVMIDTTHLKAHRTAASLMQKGELRVASVAPKAGSTPNCMPSAMDKVGQSCCCCPKDR